MLAVVVVMLARLVGSVRNLTVLLPRRGWIAPKARVAPLPPLLLTLMALEPALSIVPLNACEVLPLGLAITESEPPCSTSPDAELIRFVSAKPDC